MFMFGNFYLKLNRQRTLTPVTSSIIFSWQHSLQHCIRRGFSMQIVGYVICIKRELF